MTRPCLSILVLAALASTARGLTLDEALDAAHRRNPDLMAARHRVEQAEALLGQAKSAWYPQVSLSAGYTRTDNPPQAFFMNLNQRQASLQEDFNNPDDTENIRGTAVARMLLADGGVRSLNQAMSRMNREANQAMLDAARNDLDYAVTEAFYQSLQAGAFVAVQEETIGSVEENLRVAKARYDAGSAIQTDVLNLEVQLADARENLIRAKNRQRLAVAALNTAIGEDLARPGDLTGAAEDDPLPAPPEQVDFGRLESRPELQSARARLEAAELNLRKSGRDRAPRLMAFGSVDWDSDDFGDFEQSYLAGVMAEWDVFTGFRKDAAAAEARAAEAEARSGWESLHNRLVLDLRNAHYNALEAWERLDVSRRSVASAEEALRITRQRYEQGAADITELLTAQVGLTSTRTRSVAAHYEYRIALANLDRALGEGASTPVSKQP